MYMNQPVLASIPFFVADELAVLQRYLKRVASLQNQVAVTEIDWSALPDRQNLSDRFSKCVPHSITQRRVKATAYSVAGSLT